LVRFDIQKTQVNYYLSFYTFNPVIVIATVRMSAVADVTAQSLSIEHGNDRNSPIAQSSIDKKSHIHEHPFLKEVKFHCVFISIIHSISFSLLQVV
jgi:hypothetical protein